MRRPLIVIGATAAGAMALGLTVPILMAGASDPTLEGVLGGQRWDNWWIAGNHAEPTGDHPLYPDIGQQSGSTTWRCKECHGWDYKGKDGAYGSGSHYTGIKGVYGSTMTPLEMFDLVKNDDPPFGHGFGSTGMTDDEIWMLVTFIQDFIIDTDSVIDGAGEFIGDSDNGRYGYKAASGSFSCIRCHGEDGEAINFGTPDDPEYLYDIAAGNPWELMHKILFGDASGQMTSWVLGRHPVEGAADIGRYLQDGFPSQGYVGDESCRTCHENWPTSDFFEAYRNSGHPWKVFHNAGQEPAPDTWPHTPVPPLPMVFDQQLEWSDVELVIGNYFWKTRFVDRDGFIYTGDVDDTTQWNIWTEEFVPYHAGEVDKPFNCGRCHTTGYSPDGNMFGLPGMIGTWTEEGIRCEACHGPSQDHVEHPTQMLPEGGKECAECHYRDSEFRMPWKGGFMRHHQQSEDLLHSPHGGRLTCNNCHDPHRSTVYDDGGVTASCTDCHEGDSSNNFYIVKNMEDVACIDCHMPYMAKSAAKVNDFMADVRGHLFQITPAPLFAADNTYQVGSNLYWNQNYKGESHVTLDYACMGCHEQINQPLTIAEASAAAYRIHDRSGMNSSVVATPKKRQLNSAPPR